MYEMLLFTQLNLRFEIEVLCKHLPIEISVSCVLCLLLHCMYVCTYVCIYACYCVMHLVSLYTTYRHTYVRTYVPIHVCINYVHTYVTTFCVQDITPSKLLGNVDKAKTLNQLSAPKGD